MRAKIANCIFWPFRVIYKIYYLVIFSALMILLYPFYLHFLSNERRFPNAFRLMKSHALVLLTLTGIILKVNSQARIPQEGAFIICANHTSFLDSFCLYTIVTRYFVFTGKKEIEKWPLFHIFYTSGMNIIVDRHSAGGSLGAFRRMTQELNNGHPLAIFPEGTRPQHAPETGPFKEGAFALAIQQKVPIVPVTFLNNWRRLGRGGILSGHVGPGLSRVVIHPPVSTSGMNKNDIATLTKQVRDIISGPLI